MNETALNSPFPDIHWYFFLFVCFQLATGQPYLVLTSATRANCFSGLLCLVSLSAALFSLLKQRDTIEDSRKLYLSILLVALGFAGALSSAQPVEAFCRTAILLSSLLGGFWSARVLLSRSSERRMIFLYFCLLLLVSTILVKFALLLQFGRWLAIPGPKRHALMCLIYLLCFAPVTLLMKGSKISGMISLFTLCSAYGLAFAIRIKSALLLPFALLPLFGLKRVISRRRLIGLSLILLVIVIIYPFHLDGATIKRDRLAIGYRLEMYPFSWHILKSHPFLGNGCRVRRDKYLNNYEQSFPGLIDKAHFAEYVDFLVTSENQLLTLLADFGLPFTILLILFPAPSFLSLIDEPPVSDPLAGESLLASVTAGLLYGFTFDILFHPQLAWFLFVLLGTTLPTEQQAV